MIMKNHNILITNDDGIESPGLRAAVAAVIDIGNVTVVAPSRQQTGTGRGLTGNMESSLERIDYQVNGTAVRAYHCECSPAMAVRPIAVVRQAKLTTMESNNVP